jgi:shikimate kinase/3-dehydroquinate synthase
MRSETVERIFLIGLPGAGKTTTSRALAERLGWSCLDLDEMIAARAGRSIAAIFATDGEARFREFEGMALAKACERTRVVVATGGGVGDTPVNLATMRNGGYMVCLDVAPAIAFDRLSVEAEERDETLASLRPLLEGADPIARLTELRARRPWYRDADLIVDANTPAPDVQVGEIVASLAGAGALQADGGGSVARTIRAVTDAAYEAVVGWGEIATLGERLRALGASKRVHIVTDSHVASLYQRALEQTLAQAGFAPETFVVPAGETSKTLEQWRAILDWLVLRHAERGEFLIALGGGVIGDLAGFAAATYLRGVPLVHVPTSLLAQVDASIGGKVGVDLPQGKNLIGAFYPPRLVLSDPALLLTLAPRGFTEGWAEAVKVGVALDAAYFTLLESRVDALLGQEPAPLSEAIARAVAIKAAVVEQDEREGESGARLLLNFGHTLGHAIEQVTGYNEWLHGEAVAIGMAFAARLGRRIGVTPDDVGERQEALLTRFGLPTRLGAISPEALLAAMAHDKKARGGQRRWVIPTALGASSVIAVADEDVRATLLEFCAAE